MALCAREGASVALRRAAAPRPSIRAKVCTPLRTRAGSCSASTSSHVVNFIKKICPNDKIVENCRCILSNGKELDIVDVDKRIAIEFNGLIWHNIDKQIYNVRKIDKMYHYNKTNECNDKGYQLIHIFEDEWIENNDLCKSKLKKIFAENTIKHIDAS